MYSWSALHEIIVYNGISICSWKCPATVRCSAAQNEVKVQRMSSFSTGLETPVVFFDPVPGHALHEKGLQRQIGVGTQVSSQERRAAVVPQINWTSNRTFRSSIGFHRISLVRASGKTFRTIVWGARGAVVSWANRSVGVPSCPAPPLPAVRRPDPTRPWYVRVLDSTSFLRI